MSGKALLLGLVAALGASTSAAAEEKPDLITEVNDALSASQAAQAQGTEVLVTDETTPDTKTWALPDGDFRSEISNGPVRFRDTEGAWTDIDVTLSKRDDGSIAPEAFPEKLVIAGERKSAARSDLVSIGRGPRTIAWQWDGRLPDPELDRNRATYRNVRPGIDLVVEARRTGVEQYFVLNERPRSAPDLRLGIRLGKALTVRQTSGGEVRYVAGGVDSDADGKTDDTEIVAHTPRAGMWSAAPDGDIAKPESAPRRLPLDLVTGTGHSERSVADGAKVATESEPALVVDLEDDFYTNPDTSYPLVLDPTISLGFNTYDTWIHAASTTYSGGADPMLFVGPTWGSASRTLMNWNVQSIRGKYINSATLNLYNLTSNSPSATWRVWRLSSPANSSTTWANQPSWTGAISSTSSNGTSAGWITANVRSMAQVWADGSTNSVGMGLTRDPETGGSTSTLSINSMEGNWSVPHINVTYSHYPNTVTDFSVADMIGASDGALYVRDTTPQLRARVTDPDGGQLRGQFTIKRGSTTILSAGAGSQVYSGQESTYTVPSGLLSNGNTYTLTVKGHDGTVSSKSLSSSLSFKIDTAAPAIPTVTSSTFTEGAWTGSPAASGSFTFASGSSDIEAWVYAWDDEAPEVVEATGSSQTLSIPTGPGWRTLSVYALDRAQNASAPRTYSFGNGPGMDAPADGTVTDALTPLDATGHKDASGVKFQYRPAGSTAAWIDIPVGDVTDGGAPVSSWPVAVDHPSSSHSTAPRADGVPTLAWDVASTASSSVSKSALEVRAVFNGSPPAGSPTWSTSSVQMTLDRDAEGGSFAMESVGPCSVNLRTGSCIVDVTDATAFGMSVGRKYNTKNPDASGLFGPGWSASLPDGPSLQDAGTSVTITESDGSVVSFVLDGGTYKASTGSEGTLTKAGTGTGATYTYTRLDKSKAVFKGTSSTGTGPNASAPWEFRVESSEGAATASETKYRYISGRLSEIVAPLPAGISSDCDSSDWAAGCRSLQLTYNSYDFVEKVTLKAADPSTGAADTLDLACYAYEASGSHRLIKSWDPRPLWKECVPGYEPLKTVYAYDDDSGHPARLESVQANGLAPWTIEYDNYGSTPTDVRDAKVTAVSRSASGLHTETTSFVYEAPIDATSGPDHPDLSPAKRELWAQAQAPLSATAVFRPGTNPSDTELRDATVYALDVNGQILNEASYSGTGQEGWRTTSTTFDRHGNAVLELTPGARERVIGGSCGSGLPSGCTPQQRAQAHGTVSRYSADGSDLLDVFEPISGSYASDGSSIGVARKHVALIYGTGDTTDREADGPQHAVIKTVTGASRSWQAASTAEIDKRVVRYAYGLSGSDATGWFLLKPARVTLEMAGSESNDIVRETVFDPATGEPLQVRQPKSAGSASSPGTTKFSFYTAGVKDIPGCVNSVWAGLPCKQLPGAQPTGSLAKLPAKQVTSYDLQGRVLVETENVVDAGGVTRTRTMTTTYQSSWAGPTSPKISSLAVTGGTQLGSAVPAQTYSYWGDTLLTSSVSSGTDPDMGGTLTTAYDAYGRVSNFTDADGANTETTYDPSGRTAEIVHKDGSTTVSTATYGYDGGDERRGLLTSITYDNGVGTFSGDYNADGELINTQRPDGLDHVIQRDTHGRTTWNYYTGGFFKDDHYSYTVHDQIAQHVGYTVASSHKYEYDDAGRLTGVDETRAGQCATRKYEYDKNSNRTWTRNYGAAPDGSCGGPASSAQIFFYDDADRHLGDWGNGLNFDALSRVTTLPMSMTSNVKSADMTYYVNDMNRSITQDGQTREWTLDPAGRDRKKTVSGSLEASQSHFGDASTDSPIWTLETDASGATFRQAYIMGLDGSLAAIVSGAGSGTPSTEYQLVNAHGDVIATSGANAVAPSATFDADEWGRMRSSSGDSTQGPTYGWLGGNMRASAGASGVTRMGARLYSPTTGRFLQVDSVFGGNENPYSYVTDPLMSYDLDGLKKKKKKNKKKTRHYYFIPASWQKVGYGGVAWYRDFNVGDRGYYYRIDVITYCLCKVTVSVNNLKGSSGSITLGKYWRARFLRHGWGFHGMDTVIRVHIAPHPMAADRPGSHVAIYAYRPARWVYIAF